MKKLILAIILLIGVATAYSDTAVIGSMWKQIGAELSPADDIKSVDFTNISTIGLGGASTLQDAYDNATPGTSEIILNSTQGSFTISDKATSIGDLFKINNFANTTSFFNVDPDGVSMNEILVIGDDVTPASADPTITLLRKITGSGNGHGVSDETEFSSDGGSYSSFDSLVLTPGAFPYGHINAFQARNVFDSTSTITSFRGLRLNNIVESGIVTDYEQISVSSRQTGGTIINEYGIRMDDISKGTTLNYAIKTGAGLIDFGDTATITKNDAVSKLSITATGTGLWSIVNIQLIILNNFVQSDSLDHGWRRSAI